jgi:hypothetical protein
MIGLLQIDRLLDGDVFGFGLETFTSVMPAPILALLVFGSIGVGYYMVQGSFAIPLIMFILVGGVTIVEAPLGVTQGIVAMMVIAIAGIGYALLQRVTV